MHLYGQLHLLFMGEAELLLLLVHSQELHLLQLLHLCVCLYIVCGLLLLHLLHLQVLARGKGGAGEAGPSLARGPSSREQAPGVA